MKQLLAILLIGFLSINTSLGQSSIDLGIFGGGGSYFGDMTKVEFGKSTNPAYGAFFRYNFNPRYSLRFNVINGTIGANGLYGVHPWSFNKNVMDIAMLFEFNFLKYIVGDKVTPWSTFIYGGLGVQMYDYTYKSDLLQPLVHVSYSKIPHNSGGIQSPTIPFGLGVKYNLSRKWGIGIEGSLRKTMSDKLDDLDDPLTYLDENNFQIKFSDQMHNNDWTAYFGIHLVYKIISGNNDWEIRTPRKKMIDWGIWNKNRK